MGSHPTPCLPCTPAEHSPSIAVSLSSNALMELHSLEDCLQKTRINVQIPMILNIPFLRGIANSGKMLTASFSFCSETITNTVAEGSSS